MKINGRILNIEHIQQPTQSIEEWLNKSHTAEEVVQRLRFNDKTQFDTTDTSKELSVSEIDNMRIVKRNPVTIFNKDKIANIANEFDKLTADDYEL